MDWAIIFFETFFIMVSLEVKIISGWDCGMMSCNSKQFCSYGREYFGGGMCFYKRKRGDSCTLSEPCEAGLTCTRHHYIFGKCTGENNPPATEPILAVEPTVKVMSTGTAITKNPILNSPTTPNAEPSTNEAAGASERGKASTTKSILDTNPTAGLSSPPNNMPMSTPEGSPSMLSTHEERNPTADLRSPPNQGAMSTPEGPPSMLSTHEERNPTADLRSPPNERTMPTHEGPPSMLPTTEETMGEKTSRQRKIGNNEEENETKMVEKSTPPSGHMKTLPDIESTKMSPKPDPELKMTSKETPPTPELMSPTRETPRSPIEQTIKDGSSTESEKDKKDLKEMGELFSKLGDKLSNISRKNGE